MDMLIQRIDTMRANMFEHVLNCFHICKSRNIVLCGQDKIQVQLVCWYLMLKQKQVEHVQTGYHVHRMLDIA